MLVVEVPNDLIASSASNVQSPKEKPPHISGEQGSNLQSDVVVLEDSSLPKCTQMNYDTPRDSVSVRLDISFKSLSHTGLQTTELVSSSLLFNLVALLFMRGVNCRLLIFELFDYFAIYVILCQSIYLIMLYLKVIEWAMDIF